MLTSFVGRHVEVQQLHQLLTSARVVMVTGPGGIGKTRLVAHVARSLEQVFTAGVRTVSASDLISGNFSTHSTSSGPHLLVLDHCDLEPDAVTAAIEAELAAAPDLTVLATSRIRLPVDGAVTYRLAGLSLPEVAPHDCARGSEAVTLLVERAAAADPTFALAGQNMATVADLCRLLEGAPFAIELAAARLRTLSLFQILARLRGTTSQPDSGSGRHGLDLLTLQTGPSTKGMKPVLETMAATCTPTERALWSRVSVFTSEFGIDEIEELCYASDNDRAAAMDVVSPGAANSSRPKTRAHQGRR